MVTQLLVLIYILILLLGLGYLFLFSLRSLKVRVDLKIPIDYVVLTGFIFLHTALGYLSILFAIGKEVHLIFLFLSLGGLGISIKNSSKTKLHKFINKLRIRDLLYLPALFFILSVFFYSLYSYNHHDTGLYYIQSMEWIKYSSVIKGLGNVHGRFAFNTHFLIDQAYFDLSFLNISHNGKPVLYYSLNALLFILLLIRLTLNIRKSFIEKNSLNMLISICLLYFSFNIVTHFISNPSPDLISVTLICYIIIITLGINESNNENLTFQLFLVSGISLALITIKLSNLFLVLIPLILLVKTNPKHLLQFILVALVMISPFVIRNIYLSGYLLYPLPGLDLFSFEWEIPKPLVQSESDWIRSYAIDPTKFPNEVFAMSYSEWVPNWFLRQDRFFQFLILTSCLSPVILILKSKKSDNISNYKILEIGLLTSMIYWFFSAPDPRFIWGILVSASSLSIGFLIYYINKEKIVCIGLLVLFLYLAFNKTQSSKDMFRKARNAYPVFPYQLIDFEYNKVEALNFNIYNPANGDQCFDGPLPCAPPYGNKKISMIGKDFKEGFKPN